MDRSGQSQSAKPRKELNWWHSFNTWWRDEYDRLGRRPRMQEVDDWYREHAERTWGMDKPSLEATRDHAKCLRSKKELREYFQRYNAKKQLGRPFTDMRQMRGGRQRSGSQPVGTSTQSTRSNSDADGGGGGGTSGGTSGGLSGALSGYEVCCDGSSGGGDASGSNPGTNQASASPRQLSVMLTESPLCAGKAKRVLDQGRNQVHGGQGWTHENALGNGVVAGLNNAVSMAGVLGSCPVTSGPDADDGARLLGRLQEMCASTHFAMQQQQQQRGGDEGKNNRGGSPPFRVQLSNYKPRQHGSRPETQPSCGLGCTNIDANEIAAHGLASCNHLTAILNCRSQPSRRGGDDGGGDESGAARKVHTETSGAAPPRSSPPLVNASTVLPEMPSAHSQQQPVHCHSSVANDDTAVGASGGAHLLGNSGAAGEAAIVVPPEGQGSAAAADGQRSAVAAESCPGKPAVVTRWMADVASSAMDRWIPWDHEVLPEQDVQRADVSGAATNVIAAALSGGIQVEDLETLLSTATRRAVKQHDSVPPPPLAVAVPGGASQPQHWNRDAQALLHVAHGKAPSGEPAAADESYDRIADTTSGEPEGLKAAALAVEKEPSVRRGEIAAVTAAAASPGDADPVMHHPEGSGNVGPSATPYQEQQRRQEQASAPIASAAGAGAGAKGVESAAAGRLFLLSHCFAIGGHVGRSDDTDCGGGGHRGSGSTSPAPDGDAPKPPTLGLGEPSLSALPDLTSDDGEPAAGLTHQPPLSYRSSGAFTGCVDEPEATGGNSTNVSAGSKRSAGALELIRTPSLRVPGAPDEDAAETPSLYRAPKLLRLEHAQQGAVRCSLKHRGVEAGAGRAHTTSRPGSGPVPSGGIHSDPPPEPFRTPMLLFQRSIGKEGLSSLGGGGLTPLPSVLHARESASTRCGMLSQLPLPPRESVATAHVPPALTARESLETRLMPPPSLPLHERSSAVRSQPSSAITIQHNYPVEHPEDLLKQHMLQQQTLRKHQEQRQGQDHPPVSPSGLDAVAAVAAAVGFDGKPGSWQPVAAAQPPAFVRDGGSGNSIADGKAAAGSPQPSAGVADRLSHDVQIFLQSRGIERMRVRQPLDDGRLLEVQLQVITVCLTLPATSIGALRRRAQPL
ncbi:hypothetical protein VaNZ11_005544 [Volvox africanus]|uniref:Uncharacterized protein n=1 Tax=Volvox africanus TaxID=51714 RepID=A0ABQ5S0K5_9CHLO|nr:hypothetical protein VaNZ11_005544 [Volvox africanus]